MKQLDNWWDYGLVQPGKEFSSTFMVLLCKNTFLFVISTELWREEVDTCAYVATLNGSTPLSSWFLLFVQN